MSERDRRDLELLARIRAHPDRDTLVQALEFECDTWRSVEDEPGASEALWEALLELLQPSS